MADNELTKEELEETNGEELPDREEMASVHSPTRSRAGWCSRSSVEPPAEE
jgi:hypothetical protein